MSFSATKVALDGLLLMSVLLNRLMFRRDVVAVSARKLSVGALASLMALLCFGCVASEPEKGPYDTDPTSPEQAAQAMQIVDGFRVEVVAAEPEVVDPVDIAFDENGDLWVCEMLDYPFDPDEGEKPRSRIRFLEDQDGDGRFETATLFVDNLLQASSVMPWKGGVLVTVAPDILYFKDTDGDHKADVREVWFTGFQGREVSPEARVNSLRYGIDNWIYTANSSRPGTITSPKSPGKPSVIVRGYDFRFHPGKNEWEATAGTAQFGMSFDEWGHRFGSRNTTFLSHAVLPARYVLRNRFFSPPSMVQFTVEHDDNENFIYPLTEPQQWRIERTAARQKRYDETRPGRTEHLWGRFSAATGATVYVGDAFPEEYVGNIFNGEVNGNLVRRNIMTAHGATYRAHRAPEGEREFLAAPDNWFSPANFANAPDGNLYVVDIYREYIEEPRSIPMALQEKLQMDFYRGDDLGRIYRISPENPRQQRNLKPGLGTATTAELVETLQHTNGWHRRTAHRLLVEKQDAEAVPLLKVLTESETPQARLHALWVLEGLDALEAPMVRTALRDGHPRIRENAIKMAEAFLPGLSGTLTSMTSDEDPRVRFQLILTLGLIPRNDRVLARLIPEHADDPWFRSALLCSVGGSGMRVFNRLLTRHRQFFREPSEGRQDFLSQLSSIIGAGRNSDEMSLFLMAINDTPLLRPVEWRTAALSGLAQGLAIDGSRGVRIPSAGRIMMKLVNDRSEEVADAAREAAQYFALPAFIRKSLAEADDSDLAIEKRVRAATALRGGSYSQVDLVLAKILTTPTPQEVQSAAVDTLSGFDDAGVSETLLAGWSGYGAPVRERVAQAMMRKKEWAQALLAAVEAGTVPAPSIDAVSKIRLTQYPDAEVQERAKALLAAEVSERSTVVEEYQDTLALAGNIDHGKQVFEDQCAKCHRRQAERGRIGPDLSGVNNKTRDELLLNILDPSYDIQPSYANYIIVDTNGRIYDGLLAGETAEAVRLRGEYEDVTILRKNLAEMRTSTVSLMPDGLEEDMSRQDMADVIEYLRAGL